MKKFYSGLALIIVGAVLGCSPDSDNSDTENALLALALTAGPTSCEVKSSNGTVTMPLVYVGNGATATARSVLDDASSKYWTAVRLSDVQNGTKVAFGYDPKYAPGGPNTFIIVYVTGDCPITDLNSTSDPEGDTTSDNSTSASFFAPATHYDYDDATQTLTFDADAAGKNFIITTGVSTNPDGKSITRTN